MIFFFGYFVCLNIMVEHNLPTLYSSILFLKQGAELESLQHIIAILLRVKYCNMCTLQ